MRHPLPPTTPADERLRRWRLVLGGEADGTGRALHGRDAAMDGALAALYRGAPEEGRAGQPRSGRRSAGLGGSAPQVARWLGDIREYFPATVVQLMQQDAITRLGLEQLLLEPEMLEAVEPDVHLVATLLSLKHALPETTRETARAVVGTVVAELERRLADRTRATVGGALDRGARVGRPRHRDIDWDRTVRANLANYLPEHGTVVPERLVGYARARRAVKKDVVLCVDQSGSMAASVVHAAVFGAVLASMKSLDTRLVVFDTSVVDLTEQLADPVDVLFATQLGGGTDINRALAYCQSRITRLYRDGRRPDQRPLRGRHPGRDAQAGGRDEGGRRPVHRPAGALRRGRAGLRPRARRRAGRPRSPGLRLHPRRLPGDHGGGDREAPDPAPGPGGVKKPSAGSGNQRRVSRTERPPSRPAVNGGVGPARAGLTRTGEHGAWTSKPAGPSARRTPSGLSVTVLTKDWQAPGETGPSGGDNLPDGRDARVN